MAGNLPMTQADINGDRSVDVLDLVILADYLWGEDESDSGPQSIDSRDTKAATKASKTAVAVCDLEPVRVLRGDANDDGNVDLGDFIVMVQYILCLLYTSPSPRDRSLSRMPSSA